MTWPRRPEGWVFVILLASYAYFWQARDWNSASRLMLTYAIVDRGTVTIDGMEDQTGDRASFQRHSYSDKLPGFSLLATGPYLATRLALGLPPHPLRVPGMTHWPADYWVTLLTSGLLTAATAVLLVRIARDLGCRPRAAALVGLSYGLGTPAAVYATLSYGHQVTAFALLASLRLVWRVDAAWPGLRLFLAGFLAAYASVVELQVGPVSAILGVYLVGQVLGGVRQPKALGEFAVGAALPALLLLGYNVLAFGSPWEMGYFHHSTKIFAEVHNEANPLGLKAPDLARLGALLWGRYRGLTFYAPIVLLAPLGFLALLRQRQWGLALASLATIGAVFLVNLSYPEWTGGWSTGPRLLVPLLPFALVLVAGLLAARSRFWAGTGVVLGIGGWVLMLLFAGVGGRIPQYVADPLFDAVLPLWRGEPVEGWVGEPLARNVVAVVAPARVARLAPPVRWLQFVPLVAAHVVLAGLMVWAVGGGSDLRVDEEQEGRGQDEKAENPGTDAEGVSPDAGPGLVP